ncbi:mRNA-capping enzyme, partial [Linum perenne]
PHSILYPRIPERKRSSEFDLNRKAVPAGDSAVPLNNNQEMDAMLTIDDLLGDGDIPIYHLNTLRKICYEMLRMPMAARANPTFFPGSHPVSLSSENLQLLRERYYYVTWKPDGTRYMMLITMDGCYLIDRSYNFRRVQMRFPRRSRKSSDVPLDETHSFTLLDGEMVIDTLPDNWQLRRYLVYDLMAINHESIVERPFSERCKMIEKEVIEPRRYDRKRNPDYKYDEEPFQVRRKDFWLLSAVTTSLWKNFIPKLPHETDGLIFQGWDDPYIPKTHDGLLKWKYPEMNSVDFLFEVGPDDRQSLYLYEHGTKKLLDRSSVVFRDDVDPSSYSGKIIQCSYNSEGEVWECMRVRTDRNAPNEFDTFEKVMRSIKDNITEDILLREIHKIVRSPMYVDRIDNDSRAYKRRR